MLMGNRIPDLLRQKGWSMYKLAKESDLAYNTVFALTKADEIPGTAYYGTLKKIAEALNVSVEDLETDD